MNDARAHTHQVKNAKMEGKEELRKELEERMPKQPSRKEMFEEMVQF